MHTAGSASPVRSRDFAVVTSLDATAITPAGRPSILRNTAPGVHAKESGNSVNHRGRQQALANANASATLNTANNDNAAHPASKVNFSPLANPRINKALKSLVRSSSEPGMSRHGNAARQNKHTTAGNQAGNQTGVAVVGVGANLAAVGAATPVVHPTKGEKQEIEDEKAGMQGSKVFTVGDHNAPQTGQSISAPSTRRGLSGLFTVGGSLPLARSSEPHLPSGRTKNEIFDNEEIILQQHQNGAYPPPPPGGAAPGIAGATGGAGAPTLTFEGLLEPEKPLKPPPTWKQSMMNIVKYSWLNVLLIW